MASMRLQLPAVYHDRSGFESLLQLSARTEDSFLDDIEIDMTSTNWFDADMCAPLGAILYRLGEKLNTIRLTKIPKQVEKILSKNGFLSSYGISKIPDRWGTTIPYQRFDRKDDRYFGSYIERELVRRREMPSMSKGLLKKFRESVFEIFNNAVTHSQTQLGIFSCGQFFPGRHRIDISIADLGIGIRQNVKEQAGLNLAPDEAIVWAIKDGNTTKRGPIPGGLGLKLLRDFISLNGGRIQIISDAGYLCLRKGKTESTLLRSAFPGTVVNIEINTSDKKSYALVSEISSADIF